DTPDVAGEAIGIGADDVDGLVAIRLVDAKRPVRADAVRGKEDGDVANGFLLPPALADLLDAARADALHLLEEHRAGIDHLQRAGAESLDDALGVLRPDALDEPRTEELLDPLRRARRRRPHAVGLELDAVLRVLRPDAGRFQILAGHRSRQLADHRHRV